MVWPPVLNAMFHVILVPLHRRIAALPAKINPSICSKGNVLTALPACTVTKYQDNVRSVFFRA